MLGPVNQWRKKIDGCGYYRSRLSFLLYTYYCDYFYQSTGVKYSLRGGYSTTITVQCGAFLTRINIGDVGYSSYFGASLSFKLYLSVFL